MSQHKNILDDMGKIIFAFNCFRQELPARAGRRLPLPLAASVRSAEDQPQQVGDSGSGSG